MIKALATSLLGITLATGSASAFVIVSSVSDLNFVPSSTALSVASNTGGVMVVNTTKNQSIDALLPSEISLGDGDSIDVSLDFAINDAVVNTASSISFRFFSGTSLYAINIDPVTVSNAIDLDNSSSGVIVRKNSTGALGTSTYNVTFTIDRNTATDVDVSATGSFISGGSIAGNTSSADDTTIFDSFGIRFNGDAWNETFSPDDHKPTVTISNFSINSTVPEPSTYAAMIGALTLGVVLWRRRQ